MSRSSNNDTTPSRLFRIAAISCVVDLFLGFVFMAAEVMPPVDAFIDPVDEGYLFQMITMVMGAIMGVCLLWVMAQFFVEPYLFLKSFPRYFSQGSKKSKLQLALAQLALVITWIMCYRIMAIIAERG